MESKEKLEITIYYRKCEDGTYDIVINVNGQDVANYGGLTEGGLKHTFNEYPGAKLINATDEEESL